jgi:hypothetical protein
MASNPPTYGATPFGRLALAQAASMGGDAFLTVALAGSIFFTVPASGAQGRVVLYLLLTAAPFAVVAPVIGPALDRSRGGRRTLLVLAALGRAVLCLFMAEHVKGLLLFPLAFGALVLSKGNAVAKSSLVPAVVADDDELVEANARLALISVLAGVVAGLPAAAILKLLDARWVLVVGAFVFAAGALLAMKVPKPTRAWRPETPQERADLHAPSIVLAGSAMGVLRGGVGFVTFLLAFALKERGEPAWFYGAVLAVSAAGGLAGVLAAPRLRRRVREEVILAGSLLVPAMVVLFAARSAGRTADLVAAAVVAASAAAGRLAFDSLLQRDAPDAVRGRAFARFETRFQLIWVAGALIPVALFRVIDARVGFFVLALALGSAGLSYVGGLRATRDKRGAARSDGPPPTGPPPTGAPPTGAPPPVSGSADRGGHPPDRPDAYPRGG